MTKNLFKNRLSHVRIKCRKAIVDKDNVWV